MFCSWLLLIPVYVYFISYFTEISMVEIVSGKYWVLFLGSVLQQITTGLFEETVSRGIVMSAFRSHYENFKWRLSAVIISGVGFGLSEEVTVIASAGQVLRDVIDPFLLGILAIVICIKYDAIKNTLNK